MVLLRETPLPKDVDLRQALAGLPPQELRDARAFVEFEDWRVVPHGPETAPPDTRTFDVKQAKDLAAPLLKTHSIIEPKLADYFAKEHAISFANRGR